MAYRKTYRTQVPLEPGTDPDVALWFARESFERTASMDSLTIVEFRSQPLDWRDLPPKAEKQLGRKLSEFEWVEYIGIGERAEII